jgi:hypothetical protein
LQDYEVLCHTDKVTINYSTGILPLFDWEKNILYSFAHTFFEEIGDFLFFSLIEFVGPSCLTFFIRCLNILTSFIQSRFMSNNTLQVIIHFRINILYTDRYWLSFSYFSDCYAHTFSHMSIIARHSLHLQITMWLYSV